MSNLHNRINKYYLSDTEENQMMDSDRYSDDERWEPTDWDDKYDCDSEQPWLPNDEDYNLDTQHDKQHDISFGPHDMDAAYHDGYDTGYKRGMQHALKQRHLDALVMATILATLLGFILGTVTRITFG